MESLLKMARKLFSNKESFGDVRFKKETDLWHFKLRHINKKYLKTIMYTNIVKTGLIVHALS